MKSASFFKKHPKLSLAFFNIVLLLVIFIVFEIVLRIFAPDWLRYRMKYLNTGDGVGYGTDANWDTKYVNGQFYSFTPNSTFKIYHEEYENTVHINAMGGRRSFDGEKIDTANLIPFTGDSFVMGVGVEDTESIVAITKKQTNYNFLNLGIGGTCLPIQRKIINTRYDELGKPEIVVYGFFMGNDFDDIIRESIKKRDSSSKDTNTTKTATDVKPPSSNSFSWKLNSFINHNWLLKKLYVIQFIKQKLLNIKNKSNGKNMADMDPVFYMINKNDTAYLNTAKAEIDNEIEVLSKEPYKPVVILIPDRHQVNSLLRKNMCSYYNIDEKNMDPFLPNKILIEALNKYKIKYIDPTECIINHLNEGVLYYTRDNHFTKLGQQIISKCVADTLQKTIQELKLMK